MPATQKTAPLVGGLGIPKSLRTLPLRYVGQKPTKRDTMFGSDVTWNGPGDVQAVPENLLPHFLQFPEIWQLTDAAWSPPPPPPAGDTDTELAEAVRSGAWEKIGQVCPAAWDLAYQWCKNLRDQADGPAPIALSPGLIAGWARDTLNGSQPEIRDRLADHADLLLDYAGLIKALVDEEEAGRNRRNVLDMLATMEATLAARQQTLIGTETDPVAEQDAPNP